MNSTTNWPKPCWSCGLMSYRCGLVLTRPDIASACVIISR